MKNKMTRYGLPENEMTKYLTIITAIGYAGLVAAKSATELGSSNTGGHTAFHIIIGGFFMSMVHRVSFWRIKHEAFWLAVPVFGLPTCLVRHFSLGSESGEKFVILNTGDIS